MLTITMPDQLDNAIAKYEHAMGWCDQWAPAVDKWKADEMWRDACRELMRWWDEAVFWRRQIELEMDLEEQCKA